MDASDVEQICLELGATGRVDMQVGGGALGRGREGPGWARVVEAAWQRGSRETKRRIRASA